MAEKIKLFELDIDTKNLLTSLSNTRKEIEALQKAQKENRRESEEERKAFEANAIVLKQLSAEYRNNQKVLDAVTKAQTQTIDTVDDARKALSAISVLWAQVTKVEGENSTQAQELATRKLQLTNRLKELEAATGDTRRNVGNYTQSLKDAILQSGGLTQGALKLFDTLKANPFILLVDLLVKLGNAISKNQGIVDAFNRVWQPLNQTLDFVIGLVGDGVLVVFEKLKGLFTNFQGTVKDLGKAIVDNIINRFKAFQVLAEGVAQLFQGNFRQAIKTFSDGVIQLGTGIENATDKIGKLGTGLQNAFEVGSKVQALREEIAKLEIQAAQNDEKQRARIEALRLLAEDESKSQAQRLGFLKQAIALENELANDRQKIAEKNVELLQLENSTSRTSNENLKAIAEAQGEISRIQAERDRRSKELVSRERGLAQQQISQAKAQAALEEKLAKEELERIAKQAEERVKIFELANKTRITDETELTAEIVAEEVARYAKLLELQQDFIEKNAAARGQSEVEVQELIQGLNNQFDDFVTNLSARAAEQSIQTLTDAIQSAQKALQEGQVQQGVLLTQEQVDKEKQLLKDLEVAEIAALDQRLANNLIRQADYELQLSNIKKKNREASAALDLRLLNEEQQREAFNFQTRIALLQLQGENELNIRREQLARQQELEVAAAEAIGASTSDVEEKYRLLNQQLDREAVNVRIGLAANYLSAFAQIVGENTAFGKLAATAASLINTYQAITQALTAPTLPQRIAGVAFATATGFKAVLDINKTKVPQPKATSIPKFEEGGFVIGGRSHNAGGTTFRGSDGSAFEAEKDEALFILNRNATSKLRALSSLNAMFPMASRVGTFQSGGFPALSAGELTTIDLLSGIQQQQIVVDVKDIISETGRRVQVVDSATI